MGIRENFYTALRNDFDDHSTESFLFDFLLTERRRKGKDFAQAPLAELLDTLAKLVNRNQKLRLAPKDWDWLSSLGRRAEPGNLQMVSKATEVGKVRYKRLQEALSGHPEVVTEQDLEKLRRIVLYAVVQQDSWTFLYDAGFAPARKEHPSSQNEEHAPQTKKRKEDHMLRMLDIWCEKTGRSLFRAEDMVVSNTLTDDECQTWEEMFQVLQNMKEPTGIILPVLGDYRTGVGLYLMGAECFTAKVQREMKRQGRKCMFICLRPSDCDNYNNGQKSNLHLDMTPLDDDVEICVNLEDGKNVFSEILASDLGCEYIREMNDIAPNGTPKLLRKYFRPTKQQELEEWNSLVAEGRRELEGI